MIVSLRPLVIHLLFAPWCVRERDNLSIQSIIDGEKHEEREEKQRMKGEVENLGSNIIRERDLE